MNHSRKPKPLPIIRQDFQRRARAIAKHVDCTIQWVLTQMLAAHCRQTINTFSEIYRLRGNKDAALRTQSDHGLASKKARTKATTGGWDSR